MDDAQPPGILDVIAAAGAVGDAHIKADLGDVPDQIVSYARIHGLDIQGFRHSLETSAARHIKNRHFNEKIEKSRGQMALSDADILCIPEILAAADHLVFGAENPRHQPIIAYIKKIADGKLLLLQEARTGRRELAVISMRKYPATALSGDIAKTLEPNGRTDGGVKTHIVDIGKNVTGLVSDGGEVAAMIDDDRGVINFDLDGRTDGGAGDFITGFTPNVGGFLRAGLDCFVGWNLLAMTGLGRAV